MTPWLDQVTNYQSDVHRRRWFACELEDVEKLSGRDLDRLIEQGETLKHDATTSVARLVFGTRHIIIKRYNSRNQWHRVNRSVRRSRASRCWRMSYSFESAGLSVARPFLMLERRLGPLRRTAYFVSEALDGAELLYSLPTMEYSQQRLVAQVLKDAFERMKRASITHGDLKASNLIWKGGRIYFIDLDAARHHASKQSWLKANNKDRRRFLENWRGDDQLMSLFEDLV